MKRGKDEEKIVGPMFPRLHINDAEKGGPRAPPRNKMALYEQFSIPSQRFGSASGVVPLNPKSTANVVPSASPSQASGVERNSVHPRHLPPSTPTHFSEKFQARHSDVSLYGNAPEAQLEQREKVGQNEDFMVPVFVQARFNQSRDGSQKSIDMETLSSISSTHSGQPVERQSISTKEPKHNNFTAISKRKDLKSESNENVMTCGESGSGCVISTTDTLSRENTDGLLKEAKATSNQQRGGHVGSNLCRLHDGEACLHQDLRTNRRLDSARRGDDILVSTRDIGRENVSQPRSKSCCEEDNSRPKEPEIDSEYNSSSNRTCISLQIENVDKGDDLSETSMIDSISSVDISPDDVAGIIGQKQFWKARRAITNQQRVFAVQVFELHRLIKVQRLIAGSPHLMHEGSAFLGKSSLKGSPLRNLPLEYVIRSPPLVSNCKDDSEKPNQKMECSAENAVGKASLSSVKSGSQSLNYGPYMGNPQPVVATTDNKMGPWCFHQSPGPQWLFPVLSPTEGLVYKPYSGPGLMGTSCGGYGPFGFPPGTGNFMSSAYGISASHPQGFGVLPGTSPVCHTYFHPYGMPVVDPAISGSTVEQADPFVRADRQSQSGPALGGGVDSGMEQQSFCHVPTQKNGSVSQATKLQASKRNDLQGSTGCSPVERANEVGILHNAEEGDPLLLFPTAPVVPEGATESQDANQPTQVIKVVPHNPRSATESAARIFRFIQEERKQYDSV